MLRLIIFDFDGTLGDTRANIVMTMQDTARALGYPVAEETAIAKTIGLPLEEGFGQLYPGLTPAEMAIAAATYRDIFERNRKKLVPGLFPHVKETLAALKEKGYIMTVASSRHSTSLNVFLRDMGIAEYISYVLGADNVTKAKPDPEPVLKTLRELGYPAEEALVVGDMPVDVQMGSRAGAHTCAVTYGNAGREDLWEADYIIDDIANLLPIPDQIAQKDRCVVGIGEVLWDKFPGRKALGGAPANFAYHAAQMGHQGLVVSAVGIDRDGSGIRAELKKHALPFHLDWVPYPTGTVDADISDPNNPKYTIHTRCAWSHIPFTDELREIAARTKAVCFGTLAQWGQESRRSIRAFLDHCPPDCLKVCDINLRQNYFTKAVIRESLRRANILKLNEEELTVVTGLLGYRMAGEEVLCRRLMKSCHLDMIILTKGIHGSWIVWKDGRSFQPTPEVKVVSAVGAGDAFTGAFIGSLLHGASIEEAHRKAVRISAFVCTRKGAMPRIPEDLR